jgi:uncharacterized membrane protein YeaQ/YmgE (transglycosylase-associated protein family)
MLFILGWLIYGLCVGLIAKMLHPGEDPVGFLPTVGIGVAGSYIGGFLNWVLGATGGPFSPSGLMMGIIGGLIFCWVYRTYRINRFFQAQGRLPRNLIHKKD